MKYYLGLFVLIGSVNGLAQEYKKLDSAPRFIVQANLQTSYDNLNSELKVTHKTDKKVLNLLQVSAAIQDNTRVENAELKAKIAALQGDCGVKVNDARSSKGKVSSEGGETTSTGTQKN